MSGMSSERITVRSSSPWNCAVAVAVNISPTNSTRQPPGALPDHRSEADLHVRLVERLHAAELLDVLGLLLLDDVDDVVDRHDAQQSAVRRRPPARRRGRSPSARRATSSCAARRQHGLHLGPRDVGEARALGRGEQLAQRQHAEQSPRHVGRVDGVHRLAPLAARHRAHAAQRLLDRQRLGGRRRTRSSCGRRRSRARTRSSASVSARASAGISWRISSARSSSSSSRTSARSSGCHLGDERRRPGASSSPRARASARSSLEVLEHVGGARRSAARSGTRRRAPRGSASATSARSAGCISSVSRATLCRVLVEQVEDVRREQRGDGALGVVSWGGIMVGGSEERSRPGVGARGRGAGKLVGEGSASRPPATGQAHARWRRGAQGASAASRSAFVQRSGQCLTLVGSACAAPGPRDGAVAAPSANPGGGASRGPRRHARTCRGLEHAWHRRLTRRAWGGGARDARP